VSGLFPSGRLSLLSNTLIYGFAGLVFWLSLLTKKADFGAQPACNSAVQRPVYDPFIWLALVLLLTIPSIVRRVYVIQSSSHHLLNLKLIWPIHDSKQWRRGRKTSDRTDGPARVGEDTHNQDINKRQALLLTLLSVPFYTYSIHAFIHRQDNILGDAEHKFTQGQVRHIARTPSAPVLTFPPQTTAIAFSILSLVPAVQPMYDSLFARAKAYYAGRHDSHNPSHGHANKPQEMPLLPTTPSHQPPDHSHEQTHYIPPDASGPLLPTPGSAYLDQHQTRPTAGDSLSDNHIGYVPPVWQPNYNHGTGYGAPSSSNTPWPYGGV
jgi:hypothetical protein